MSPKRLRKLATVRAVRSSGLRSEPSEQEPWVGPAQLTLYLQVVAKAPEPVVSACSASSEAFPRVRSHGPQARESAAPAQLSSVQSRRALARNRRNWTSA